MSTALTVVSLAVVALLLARDWGHRRVTLFPLIRPLLGVFIVPFVAPGWNASGNGLYLELGALVLGVAIGMLTFAFIRVSVDEDGQAWTDAGYPYAAIWIGFTALRLLFVYGVEHWFTHSVGVFLIDNHINVNAFAYSIIILFLAPVVSNRLCILVSSRMKKAAGRSARQPAGAL
jgi:hypothetical protein